MQVLSRKFIIRSIAFVMLYVAAASYIFRNEDSFFYKHESLQKDHQYDLPVDFQELIIPVNEDVVLHALWLKNDEKKGVALYFPDGNYISGEINKSQYFYFELGYDVIIPEYRGNGKSTGKYESEEVFYEDALQWIKMSLSLADSLSVIVVGQEFGSGIAAWVYKNNLADLLILEKPYLSWNDIMLKKYFWWLPHSYFTNFKIPTWKYLRASLHPVVIIHPTESKDIKFKNSELLLEYFKPGDQLITLKTQEIDYESEEFLNKFEKIKLP